MFHPRLINRPLAANDLRLRIGQRKSPPPRESRQRGSSGYLQLRLFGYLVMYTYFQILMYLSIAKCVLISPIGDLSCV